MAGSGIFQEFLEFLGVDARTRPAGFAEHLFHAFQHRVPFHRAPVPARDPETVLSECLEPGRGTSGPERAAALHALLGAAGLAVELRPVDPIPDATAAPVSGRRAASVVTTGEGQFLLDATLPAALLLAEGEASVPTPIGALTAIPRAGGWQLLLESQGEERCLGLVGDDRLEDLESSDPSPEPELFRFLPDRTISWSAGRMEVCDPWSRLEFPLPASQTDALAGLFGEPLPETLSPEVPALPPSLSVFCATARREEELIDVLTHPERHVVILPAGTVIESLQQDARGWFWTLTLDSSKVSEEMVRIEPDGVVVHYGGSGVPLKEKRIRVEARPSGSRLISTGILSRPMPPTGPSESVRKTIVFHLASELLALAEKTG